MAKKKPNPAAIAQRKQERVDFVKSHPNLAPEQARQRFYVQTRTEELSAAGKSVDKKALREKFQSGKVSREGFYTPTDVARFNTSGSNNGGSLAESKNDTSITNSPTNLTTPTGVKSPAASYMAPKQTTALGLEIAPSAIVPSAPTSTTPTTIPVTDTAPKTVVKTGNISGPNVRMGTKQAQPTKTPTVTGKTVDQVSKDMGITWNPNTVGSQLPDSVIGATGKDYKTSGKGDPALTGYVKSQEENRKEFARPGIFGMPAEEAIITAVGGAIGGALGGKQGSAIGSGGANYLYNMLDPWDTSDSSGEAGKKAAIIGTVDLAGGFILDDIVKGYAPMIGPKLGSAVNKIFGAKTITDDALMAADDVARTLDYSQWSRDVNVPGTATPKPPVAPKVVDPIARQQAADAALLKPKAPSTPKAPKTPKADKISMSGLGPDANYVDIAKSKLNRLNIKTNAELASTLEQHPAATLATKETEGIFPLTGKTALPNTVEPIFPNQRLALPRGDAFQTPAPVVETPKPLTGADRLDNAAAVVAKNSNTKPPVAQVEPVQPWTTAPTAAEGPAYRAHQKLLQEIEAEQTARVVDPNPSLADSKARALEQQPKTTFSKVEADIEATRSADAAAGFDAPPDPTIDDFLRSENILPTAKAQDTLPTAPKTLTPAEKGAATKARNKAKKAEQQEPLMDGVEDWIDDMARNAETPTGATAPRDFAAELRKQHETQDFKLDDDLLEWIGLNADEAGLVMDDVYSLTRSDAVMREQAMLEGGTPGFTKIDDLSGISGQRVSRSDLFDGPRNIGGRGLNRKSPMDRGAFVEDAGAQPVGNLNPTPESAANILEHKGIKYTVDPDNPMIGIQEGTGVQFRLRAPSKAGVPGKPHTSGVDVATGKPKLRTPRTKFADDVERKAAEKTAEQTRTAATSAKRAKGATTTEQVLKAAQEKADAGKIVTQGEFSVAPKLRGKKLQQYNRDVASGKIKIDVATGKTKRTYEPSIASQEPFVYSSKAVTQDPVIGQGSIPNKSVTSLGTTKAPVKPMDDETFKKLSNDMTNRASNPLRDITDTSRVAKLQYDEVVAVYGQEAADKLLKSVEMRQIVSGQQKFGSELTEGLGASAKANNTQGTLQSASAYVEWFKSPEAQKMLIDDPARYYRIVGNKQNIAAMEVVGKANEVNAGTTAPRSMRQANNDVNSSLAEHQTALREARTKEEVVFGINADTPTPARVDAEFTDAGYADSAFAKEEAEIARGIAWVDSKPSQPIRDTAWERSYSAKQTASADAAETIANGSDDEVVALARKYEVPIAGDNAAEGVNVAQLRKDLAKKLSRSDSGPGRTGRRPQARADGVPPPVKPIENDLVAQGLNKAQIKEAYDVHRKAYQDWADEAVFDENPFANQFRFAEAPQPRAKAASVNRTTAHPDGTPEPTLTELPLKLKEDDLRVKIGKDGYKKADMDAEIAANIKLRAEISVVRQKEAAAITKWNNEAVTTTAPKKDHWTVAADAKDDAWGLENRELLATNPEEWHAMRQRIEDKRIARHVADISTPEGEAARAGAVKENARMEAHRAELRMPEIQPDRNVLQQEDWVSEVSRRFFGSTNAQAPTIPVARTPRSAMPEVSVADWETSVNQRFNNPSGDTPRLRRPGAPNRPFEAGEDTLGDLSMITDQKHGLELSAEALGMSGPVNDWSVAQARSSAQKGTSALSGYVDDVSASVQQMKAELGDLAGKLNKATTTAQQRKITGQMRNLQDEINVKETTRIPEDRDNFEFDLGLD